MIELSPIAPLLAADHSTMVIVVVLILGGIGGLAAWLARPSLRRPPRVRRNR